MVLGVAVVASLGPGKRGHIIADTLLLMMFLVLRKLGNICCGHKMFLNKIRNIFCVPDTKFVSATNVARVGKRGNICVGNNVSATMCPRLPGPLNSLLATTKTSICGVARNATLETYEGLGPEGPSTRRTRQILINGGNSLSVF